MPEEADKPTQAEARPRRNRAAAPAPSPATPPDVEPLSWIAPDLRPLARPISELVEDPENARAHPEENLAAIRRSLVRFGQRKPIVVRAETGVVVAGNGTLAVARELGWSHVAASVQSMTESEARAYAIADNRTAELAEWRPERLAASLEALGDFMPALDLGFTEADLREILPEPEAPPEDPRPWNPPKDPVSRRGEIYQLGPHRLLCGDSTDEADVARLLDGATPNLMVTDPPYGVDYDPTWREDVVTIAPVRLTGRVENDDVADWTPAYRLFRGNVAYVWHASSRSWLFAGGLLDAGFEIRAQIIWAKASPTLSRGAYHFQHEPCWYAVRKGSTAGWIGDRKQTTLWQIAGFNPLGRSTTAAEDEKLGHGTQKPLECMERPIRNHEGDVYDPFAGSGTTLIAASRQGRRCYAVEIVPSYCDVIRKRWGDYARANGMDPGPGAL